MSDERMTSKPTYEGVTTRRGLGTPARGGPGPWLAFLLALALVAVAFLGVRGRTRAPRGVPAPDSTRGGARAVQLYFAAPEGDRLVSESREILEPSSLRERVAALVTELDRGPRGDGVPALPTGTAVLRAYLDDRGLLTLDLSGAFLRGFSGGSTAEYLAIASLLRTLGANLPEVKRVRLACSGRPIATLGGHVALDRPLDVHDWP